MIIIFKNISEEISKKKNKILGVLGKESKNTLYKLAVYRIFNEIIVDKSKAPILSKKVIDELIVKNLFILDKKLL